MRHVLTRWVPLAALATLALGIVLLLVPIDRELVLRVYLLVVGGLALATLAAAAAFPARRRTSAFEAALRRTRAGPSRPEELERLERQVALGVENAADFHFRLRPSLVVAAEGAVWRRHGVPLERARPFLPEELWEVVRPDRPAPFDRRAPGPPVERIEALLDEIERMWT